QASKSAPAGTGVSPLTSCTSIWRCGRGGSAGTVALICLGTRGRFKTLISLDDALHERMADDIAGRELREGDARHALQHLRRVLETGKLVFWQVDLRQVAGDHRARTEAQPRDQHLHLFDGGVL